MRTRPRRTTALQHPIQSRAGIVNSGKTKRAVAVIRGRVRGVGKKAIGRMSATATGWGGRVARF